LNYTRGTVNLPVPPPSGKGRGTGLRFRWSDLDCGSDHGGGDRVRASWVWGALLATLVAADTVHAAGGARPAADWRPIVSPAQQVFPALLIATANLRAPAAQPPDGVLGDPHGMVGVALAATRDGQRARVSIEAPGLGAPSSIEVVLPRAGDWYQVYPTMRWDFARLQDQRRAAPATIEFAVEVDGQPATRRVQRVRLRAVNEAPYSIDDDGRRTDLSWMFAAYVDEEHPLVQRILGEALAAGHVDRFDGYQSGDPQQVYRQVFAVWQVLARHGMRYSSIARTSAAQDAVLSQYVRFLDESWENRQANCVDGAVLLASVLRRIDLDVQLVLVPGHMFLAFDLAPGGERAYLETTRLGDVAGKAGQGALLHNFQQAVEEGLARHAQAQDRFGRADAPEYRIIDIDAARRLGVAPIAVR